MRSEPANQHPPLILGIYGSPREGGNTDVLMDAALDAARATGANTEAVYLRNLNIRPCVESYHCREDGTCSIRDDYNDIEPRLYEADAILVGTPIFFYSVSAHLKIFMDRGQVFWVRKHVLKRPAERTRPGALIAVGATNGKRLFDGAILSARYFFDALDVQLADPLLLYGLEHKGDARKHPEHLASAAALGRKLAERAVKSIR